MFYRQNDKERFESLNKYRYDNNIILYSYVNEYLYYVDYICKYL